jgi:preprotein translocase subunit Sec61beta
MALSTPQQQAGILSFYDAPERGPSMNAKIVIIAVALFTLLIIIFDHFAALSGL